MRATLKSSKNAKFTAPEDIRVSGFNCCTQFDTLPPALFVRLTLSGILYDGSDVSNNKPRKLVYMQEAYSLENTPFFDMPDNQDGLTNVSVRDVMDALPDVHPQHGVVTFNAETLAFTFDSEFTITNDEGVEETVNRKEYGAPIEITYARWIPEGGGKTVYSAIGIINTPLSLWVVSFEESVRAGDDDNAMMSALSQALASLMGHKGSRPNMLPLPAAMAGKFIMTEKMFGGALDEAFEMPHGSVAGYAAAGMLRLVSPVPQVTPMIADLAMQAIDNIPAWKNGHASLFSTYMPTETLAKYVPGWTEETYIVDAAEVIRAVMAKGNEATVEEAEDARLIQENTSYILRSLPRVVNTTVNKVCIANPFVPAVDDDDEPVSEAGAVYHTHAVAREEGEPAPDSDGEGWSDFEPLEDADTTDFDDFLRSLLD